MILPYVYRCTHNNTKEFYIGVRWANKVCSTEDLGVYYFTSSNAVKNNFNEFSSEIIAEFFDPDDAWKFEQNLIKENWGNKLLLNKHVLTDSKRLFRNVGGYKLSLETRLRQSKPKSDLAKKNIGDANRKRFLDPLERQKLRKPKSAETKLRMSAAQKHKVISEEQRKKSSMINKALGIKPQRIECSCVVCKSVFGINVIKRHVEMKHGESI